MECTSGTQQQMPLGPGPCQQCSPASSRVPRLYAAPCAACRGPALITCTPAQHKQVPCAVQHSTGWGPRCGGGPRAGRLTLCRLAALWHVLCGRLGAAVRHRHHPGDPALPEGVQRPHVCGSWRRQDAPVVPFCMCCSRVCLCVCMHTGTKNRADALILIACVYALQLCACACVGCVAARLQAESTSSEVSGRTCWSSLCLAFLDAVL